MNKLSGFALLSTILLPSAAWAYLDPGSGSMLLQLVLGGFAALGVIVKLYWYRIKNALGLGNKKQADE